MKFILILPFLFVSLIVQPAFGEKISVFVSILPQKYFLEQIGKNLLDVKVMVRPNSNPATYEPKPRQIAALTKAKIYFAIGVPFERAWLKKISATNPKMKVVYLDHGIKKISMTALHHHKNESEEHEDEMGIPDPHIWLSPPLVRQMAHTIYNTLKQADPSNSINYEANYHAFTASITALDRDLRNIFDNKKNRQFMVFHPSWGYFADTYRLEQIPIEIEGKKPKPAQLSKLIMHARQNNIQIIFVQPQFSIKSAELIANAIKGQLVVADPLAEDWEKNLRDVANKFEMVMH